MANACARQLPEAAFPKTVSSKNVSGDTPELHIDVTRTGNRLKIGASEQFADDVSTVQRYDDLEAPLDIVEARCQEIVRMLNTANRRGRITRDILIKIRETGQLLTDDLFPAHVKDTLQKTTAEHLIFHLDDGMVHIPWELFHDGETFLCRRFSIGRLVRTRQKTVASVRPRTITSPLKLLILADPAGDLKNAYAEGVELRNQMDHRGSQVQAAFCADNITPESVRERIRRYDLVHFAGHCDYDAETPAKSGWRLTDGHLFARDIIKMAGNGTMPAFIFSNGCQSARTGEWQISDRFNNDVFGLANAFVLSGVKHYLGTFWEMPDEPCRTYAASFYKFLLEANSVGVAVRKARESLIREYGEETIVWASYLLYGDPKFKYVTETPLPKSVAPETLRASGVSPKIRGKRADQETIIDFGKEAQPRKRSSFPVRIAAVLLIFLFLGWGILEFFNTGSSEIRKAALAHYHSGDYDSALKTCDTLIQSGKNLQLAHLIRGDIFLKRGDAEKARAAFRKAIDVDNGLTAQRSQALLGLGRIAAILGEPDQALAYYKEAADADPAGGNGYLYQGMLLSQNGESEAALELFQKAHERMPDDPGVAAMVHRTAATVKAVRNVERRERVDQLIQELTRQIGRTGAKGVSPLDTAQQTDTVTMWIMPPENIGYAAQEGASVLFAAGMSDALLKKDKLRLVERDILDALLAELKLSSTRLTDKGAALSLGRMLAARLILTGRIVHDETEHRISVRLIETETGEIIGTAGLTLKPGDSFYPSATQMAETVWDSVQTRYFPAEKGNG